MPQIRLTGHIDVPEARRAAIAAALPEHIRLTRAEPGCITFSVTPDRMLEGRWQVSELFESPEHFAAHQARVADSDWGRISAGLPRTYEVEEVEA